MHHRQCCCSVEQEAAHEKNGDSTMRHVCHKIAHHGALLHSAVAGSTCYSWIPTTRVALHRCQHVTMKTTLKEIMHGVRHHELAGSKARTKGAECQGAEWFIVLTMGTTWHGSRASTVGHSHMHH
eukprot:EC797754.1.p1 GENE.EC797754.1~~EC797754.1.p1  ORF type:complete len:125 (-),score=8.15 EC797754.1:61-435(-)